MAAMPGTRTHPGHFLEAGDGRLRQALHVRSALGMVSHLQRVSVCGVEQIADLQARAAAVSKAQLAAGRASFLTFSL